MVFFGIGSKRFLSFGTDYAQRKRIIKHTGFVQKLVRGPANRDAQRSFAKFALLHEIAPGLRPDSRLHGFAFLTGANFAQELPRVDAEVVIVVPLKTDGIFAHALGRNGSCRGFEHGQRAGGKLGWFARFASVFAALFVAHRARAGVAKENEIVVRNVTIRPLDIHTRAGG